jgi:ATP-binding cassette subfamily B protein
MLAFTPALRRNQREYFAKFADQWSYLIETISGIGTVKSMAVEAVIRKKWEKLFGKSLVTGARGSRIEAAYSSLALFLSATASALFLWFGAGQAQQGALTAGQLVALAAIAGNIIDPILRLVEAWQEFQDVRNALERINDVFEAEPEEQQSRGRSLLTLPRIQGALRFERVTFRYTPSQDKPILANLTFEIKAGETVAIVGRSGCGKSTLAKLVLGLYLPTEGRVFIDGHDMGILNRSALRAKIGVVPQEVFLFSGTIRENVAFGQDDVTQDRIAAACSSAAADHFIADLGLGYDTKVGERGLSLSGGQRQRIALARALLREPDLLILDEATSALDTDSERIIQKNLEKLMRGKTKIIIAHRLSTVQNADRIIVLDKGLLVEEGSHADLVTRGGLYAHLAGQQLSL